MFEGQGQREGQASLIHVASGFEHSIANVYFIPVALFIKAGAPDSFWQAIGRTPADFPNLTWTDFLANLVPVTLGNIIGGSVMVAAVYWFVYLRSGREPELYCVRTQ